MDFILKINKYKHFLKQLEITWAVPGQGGEQIVIYLLEPIFFNNSHCINLSFEFYVMDNRVYYDDQLTN